MNFYPCTHYPDLLYSSGQVQPSWQLMTPGASYSVLPETPLQPTGLSPASSFPPIPHPLPHPSLPWTPSPCMQNKIRQHKPHSFRGIFTGKGRNKPWHQPKSSPKFQSCSRALPVLKYLELFHSSKADISFFQVARLFQRTKIAHTFWQWTF